MGSLGGYRHFEHFSLLNQMERANLGLRNSVSAEPFLQNVYLPQCNTYIQRK